ncbi:MAG: hypothetical protein WCH21_02210 [Bacteroidota bacterium]
MAKVSDNFYIKVLQYMGQLPTTNNVNFLRLWQTYEGGNAANNPLNTTYKLAGATNYNSANVKNYANETDGITATAKTLLLNYYKPITAGLKKNSDLSYYKNNSEVEKAINTWGTENFAKFLNKQGQQIINTPTESPEEKKNFFNEYKKPLLITAGVLTLFTILYFTSDAKKFKRQF